MSNLFTEFVAWLSFIGIPSIFSMVVWCIKCYKKYSKQLHILAKAQQAQMRNQLLEQFHFYVDSGWISEEHMEDWENQYQAYHQLGENGVLDSRREILMRLPNSNPENK